MLKLVVAAALLGGVSTFAALPEAPPPVAPTTTAKTDRLEAQPASGVRAFPLPRRDGRPVAFCLSGSSRCGKEVADRFCRDMGFKEARTFERDGTDQDTARIGFRQINCWQSMKAASAGERAHTTENLTVLVKNQIFPIRAPRSADSCAIATCFEI